jgi:hypothetical protein
VVLDGHFLVEFFLWKSDDKLACVFDGDAVVLELHLCAGLLCVH